MEKFGIVICALLGVALGGNIHGAPAQAILPAAPAPVAYAHVSEPQAQSAPQHYAHEVPAAAIRNVETVDVTKTITPVVTKTTTRKTHSEPALSVGHVQGYSQSAHGPAKIAPVQYNTQYTQYLNPTVGVNGPVTYSGPALGPGVAVQEGVAIQPAPVAVAQPGIAAAVPVQEGIAVGDPQPVAYAQHGFLNAAQFRQPAIYAHAAPAAIAAPAYNAAPAAYNLAAPQAYNGAFGGRIVNPAPLHGFNNIQPQFLNAGQIQPAPQFLNAQYAAPARPAYAAPAPHAYAAPAPHAYSAPAHAYAAPAAAFNAPNAAAIGITAFDASSLLSSAGYESAHQHLNTAF